MKYPCVMVTQKENEGWRYGGVSLDRILKGIPRLAKSKLIVALASNIGEQDMSGFRNKVLRF